MAEIINVEEARAYARERWPSPVVRRPIEALLDDCPRVEVIRCADCKHWGTGYIAETNEVKECKCGMYMVGKNGYCCYGEKKENDHAAD